MNKQELIDELKKLLAIPSEVQGHNYGLRRAIALAKQLDEPEKPLVPQFVADWYEEHKDNFEIYISELCRNFTFNRERLNYKLANWYEQLENKPIQTLVNMHQFGYEVEKEKLYTVELPNPNYGERPILYKNRDGNVSIIFPSDPCWREVKNAQLTESEIKEDFEWAWQFAKEVEEC